MSGPGQPTKFTEETAAKFIDAVRLGSPYYLAAQYAGIGYSTFQNWRRLAVNDKIPEYITFMADVKKAKGAGAVTWLQVIENAMKDSWQAAAWKLERRFYKYYSTNPVLLQDVKMLGIKLDRLEKQLTGQKDLGNEGTPSLALDKKEFDDCP